EAKLFYLQGSFDVIRSGAYVVCAMTKERVPLDELRYWNADLQEAYATCEAATQRSEELRASQA
ncbi:MAG: DUF2093 domain-containing protein, partial [Proteobacteria bacterium]|nr:DUF2093 domain-containing protein [Pseudomonadota bacterium]